MRSKTLSLSRVAIFTLAAATLATPALAHHRHHAMSSQSTPAEKQQTAQLNRQQLTNPGLGGAQGIDATAGGQPTTLQTQPASYQRQPSSPAGQASPSAMGGSDGGTTGAPPDSNGPSAADSGTPSATPATPPSGNPQ